MHKSSVISGMVGILVLITGAIQGLALGGVLGTSLYENPPLLSGVVGGLIPFISGILGTLLIACGLEDPKHHQ